MRWSLAFWQQNAADREVHQTEFKSGEYGGQSAENQNSANDC
jgi:hypothetical protein